MKQKNLILMVVAVGCGLVAALLTSQMSAKPKADTVDVIVAAKDLPVGSVFTKEDAPKMLKMRKVPKDALPPAYVQSEEELYEKRLSRGIRSDEWFNPADLTKGSSVTLPKGMDMISMSVGLPEAVAGFVTPGSRVDVLATLNGGKRQVAFPLLVDMLVLAVDNQTQLPQGQGSFAALNTVSFAVDRKQALLIQLARTRGCGMSLVLRHPDKTKLDEQWTPDQVMNLLQNPDAIGGMTGDGIVQGSPVGQEKDPKTPTTPAVKPSTEMVALPVAKADIPAGTELTIDVIKDKFEFKNVPASEAPPNAILEIEGQQGKVLTNALAASQWLPKTWVGNFAAGKGSPKAEFDPNQKGGPEDAPKVAVGPPKRVHDIFVVAGSGHKIFRYEEKSSGEWALVGELQKNGDSLVPWTPAPEPKPEVGPKADKLD